MDNIVRALAVYDDGTGPAVYAGGDFTTAGGTTTDHIAKWNDTSWTSLGSGTNSRVHSFAVSDPGTGPALYVGGQFSIAGGAIAKGDAANRTTLGNGLGSTVWALTTYDDGGGPALYAGGHFLAAGAIAANRIAKWDGTRWTALGSGMDNTVCVLAEHDDGTGSVLFAGGSFKTALDSNDSYLAKWGCTPDTTAPVLTCPASLTIGSGFQLHGTVVNYRVTVTDDQDPEPVVVCTPPPGSFFPLGTTLVTCTATDAAGNQSNCEFPVTVHTEARKQQGAWAGGLLPVFSEGGGVAGHRRLHRKESVRGLVRPRQPRQTSPKIAMAKRPKSWRIVCTRCLEEGDARRVVPGSDLIEVALYIVTVPLLCVGGLLYTGLRNLHGHWACPVCTCADVVPTGSKRGKAIRSER